jgi:hypothetical protein
MQYYLTVNNGGHGSTGGSDWYDAGFTAHASLTDGMISDSPNTRYVFINWIGDASGSIYSASNGILMDGPKTATANWQTEYLVTFSVNPAGYGSTTPNTETWAIAGATITISATPTGTYSFINWSPTANIAITDSSISVTTATINAPGTITANFG